MKQPTILLIINPKSGKNRALKDYPALLSFLETQGQVEVFFTQKNQEFNSLTHLKKTYPSLQWIVVCGGDGTLNTVVNAFYSFDDLQFVFLPYGTVNIFAKENNYPKDRKKALEKIFLQGVKRQVFLGSAQNKQFLLMASVGFDGYLVQKVEQKGKKLGVFSYVFAFFRYVFSYDFSKTFDIIIDDKIHEQGSFIVVSNCQKYGGFLNFTPQSSFFRKNFDIFIFKGKNFWSLLFFMLKFLRVKHKEVAQTKIYQGYCVSIKGAGVLQMDGEVGNTLPITIKKQEKGVSFVLP